MGEDNADEIQPAIKKSTQMEKKRKDKEVKEKPTELKKKSSRKLEIVDSDLSEVDSEFEDIESGSDEEDIDFDANVDESDSDNEAPEEVQTVSKSSRKRQLEKETKRKEIRMESKDDEEEESFGDSESEDSDDDDSEQSNSEEQPPKKVAKKSSALNSDGDSDSEFDVSNSDAEEEPEKPDVWEDIYGRKRDKQGNIIKEESNEIPESGKYIPPHLRARLQADANGNSNGPDDDPKRKEKLMRLKKLLKGFMNRLSEANMHKISTEIDNLYMQNSRNDMNVTLASLMNDALISQALAPERMVMEHALLIAALHANVGTEVGANLLESLVDRFHQMIDNGIQQYEVEDKTLDNVILILCHMHTFRVRIHFILYLM